MIHYLLYGMLLGLSAGFAPGPLLALTVSETLQHGIKSGLKVAVVPVITDLPIVMAALYLFARLSGFNIILGAVSVFGGLFVLYLGMHCILVSRERCRRDSGTPRSLAKGILVNILSPHPYLFWLSIGAPVTIRALHEGVFAACAFAGSFYAMLVGAKIFVAFTVNRFRSFMSGRVYRCILGVLGLLLCILAIAFFRESLRLWGLFR